MLRPPVLDSIDAYGARLGDTTYWHPYAEAALAASGLSEGALLSGFEGAYPTLVGGRLVVKLFGYFPSWRESAEAEIAANHLNENLGISAPTIVASGSLFPGSEAGWPFLIMERLNGQAWREAELGAAAAGSVASQLGAQIPALLGAGQPARWSG